VDYLKWNIDLALHLVSVLPGRIEEGTVVD
jgi:hypothetical protein